MATLAPRLAIFPWGDVIEEFLDPLGLDAQAFAERMRGGWLFGYVAGLALQGIEAVIVYGSERVDAPRRLIHAETGAAIWLVPARRSGGGRAGASPSLRAAAQWLRTPYRAFADILRRERCTAVLVQDYEHPRFDALVTLARSLRLPVHASFQGGDHTGSPLERRVRGAALKACATLIVPSARERERLGAVYGVAGEGVLDVPNPVDTEAWRADDRAQARAGLGVPSSAFLVVNHGRIDIHRKGLDVILAAWSQVAAQTPQAQLILIGSGQDDAAFADLAAAVPGCRWLSGYVTDPQMIRSWLSAADVYLTLSRTEGMPVAPLEAMACGLPVVASDAHGLADIFRGGEASGGLLAPREDASAAAAALLRLARDPAERLRLGATARRNVEARYSTAAVGAALAQALRFNCGAGVAAVLGGEGQTLAKRPRQATPPERLGRSSH